VNELQENVETSLKISDKKYPVAEIFTSPQGEGLYTGTLMTFIRLAGCSVGKKFPTEMYHDTDFPVYLEQCTTYDGRAFCCDTDFRTKSVMSLKDIMKQIPDDVVHVCITGGEPLIHDLSPLIAFLIARQTNAKVYGPFIHIETSGTVSLSSYIAECIENGIIWLTVSPKLGVLPDVLDLADEVKLLVDDDFDESKLPVGKWQDKVGTIVWIQPINGEKSIHARNMGKVLGLQKRHSLWRISSQMHKIWSVR